MAPFGKIPSAATVSPKPFTAHVDEQDLQDFKQLIKLSRVGPACFENSNLVAGKYGTTHEWTIKAKQYWETEFDWRKQEDHINSYPNFKAHVSDFNDAGHTVEIHFMALFSEKEDALPIVM